MRVALDTGAVALDNLSGVAVSGLSVESEVLSLGGALLDDRAARGLGLAPPHVRTEVLTPAVPSGSLVRVYFVELLLRRGGSVIDRSVYWLSTQPDVVNWRKMLGQPQSVITQYANLRSLRSLPRSSVSATASTVRRTGPDGADLATAVMITNTSSSTVAFLLRADVRRGTAGGRELPGDQRAAVLAVAGQRRHAVPRRVADPDRHLQLCRPAGATPVTSLSGWNVPKIDIAAPVP